MSRILLLLIFLIWLAWTPRSAGLLADSLAEGLAIFFGGYAVLVLGLGAWSRLLARRAGRRDLYRGVARFNHVMLGARAFVPAWFALGVFGLGWGAALRAALPVSERWPMELPGIILGTLPAFAAWAALWWAQYPVDRARREQELLVQLDQNLPVHAPARLWQYLFAQLRLQLLFMIVPVLLILLARDVVVLVLRQFEFGRAAGGQVDGLIMLVAAGTVFVMAPEILKRVLHTQPLPPSPLRRRLEALCRRNALRYRDILLWHTDNNMGNAAVMGVVPRFRYILLSDLLLETMTDEQIEAVFAHEMGHVVHRHMSWYVVFILILVLLLAGPGALAAQWLDGWELPAWLPAELLLTLAGVGMFVLLFGYLSRRFERQADVFAARSLEEGSGFRVQGSALSVPDPESQTLEAEPSAGGTSPARHQAGADRLLTGAARSAGSAVGPYGAGVFCSALQRVAVVNNIPVNAPSWCHGSIATRMGYLREMAEHPLHTSRFDRMMRRLYLGLLLAVALFGGWAMAAWWTA